MGVAVGAGGGTATGARVGGGGGGVFVGAGWRGGGDVRAFFAGGRSPPPKLGVVSPLSPALFLL